MKVMNKKANTALFIVLASLFNLVLMGTLVVVTFLVVAGLFSDLSGPLTGLLAFVVVGVPIVAAFLIYGVVMRWIRKRWNLEQYLHPIFRRRRG
jgi:ACR3 family arsenite efflux pump ArsB